MFFNLKKIAAASIAVLLTVSSVSYADISEGTWALNKSNTFANGPVYGEVNIKADSSSGVVDFKITASTDIYDSLVTNFGIQRFGFNFTGSSAFTSDLADIGWSMNTNQNISTYGSFELVPTGTGSSRQQPLVFALTMADPSQAVASYFASSYPNTSGDFFVAHVAGFNVNGLTQTSHYIAGGAPVHVPAPGAICLAGLGLGTIVLIKKRYTSQNTDAGL